jgi:hypothetical protein
VSDQGAYARRAATPWRGDGAMMIAAKARGKRGKAVSVCEQLTGMSEAEIVAWHRAERERMLAKYGMRP